MNIYITQDNEEWLRQRGESMSGLINELIQQHRGILKDAKNPTKKLPNTESEDFKKIPFFEKNIGKGLRGNYGLCKKHGTPLTLEGKCLQKGH